MRDQFDAIRGCMFGAAFGDSLAKRTEFLKLEQILERYPPAGPTELLGVPALVTDDTQMALAVADALVVAGTHYTPLAFENALRAAFVRWLNDPANTRAPGATCLQACENLERGMHWHNATILRSKGCGANMRVTPVGCLVNVTDSERAALAQLQAAMTHAHPTALAAADLTAWTISYLRQQPETQLIIPQIQAYIRSQHAVYHHAWLGNLWQHFGADSAEQYIHAGWRECSVVVERLATALAHPDITTDPCLQTGAGWIAEEAFATGLLCFLLFPDNPHHAIQRAAATSGDSDSIACLTGAFAGAYCGATTWQKSWYAQIEYSDDIERWVQWCVTQPEDRKQQ